MTLKVAIFQPVVLAIDTVPPVEFSRMMSLVENLHSHPELDDSKTRGISVRGGQQVQVYPNSLNIDVTWLVKYLETICQGYMELVAAQSGTQDLTLCKPVITSIWTIRQWQDSYQEMHTHPGGNLSGNIYITAPDLIENSQPSDGQLLFRLPHTRDITRFVMQDTWKYTPTPGTVVVFPSYLPHTVYPWKGTGTRTVLAFDSVLVPKEQ